jgi:hypothetical protein
MFIVHLNTENPTNIWNLRPSSSVWTLENMHAGSDTRRPRISAVVPPLPSRLIYPDDIRLL